MLCVFIAIVYLFVLSHKITAAEIIILINMNTSN